MQKTKFAFIMFSVMWVFTPMANAKIAARDIGEAIKNVVSDAEVEGMRERMATHYRRLRLLDETGAWTIESVRKHGDYLLPAQLTTEGIHRFIDEMATHVNDNAYLRDFLANSSAEDFPRLVSRFKAEGHIEMPDIIAYAQVLNRLTIILYDDYRILGSLLDHFKSMREGANRKMLDHFSLFEKAKLFSVELPIANFIKYREDDHIPPLVPRITLPVNILEAVLVDSRARRHGNAYAGLVLAANKSGKRYDPKTGEDAPRLSEDGKAVEYRMPFPRSWADLYTTWNLTFVSQYQDFPYYFVKLLIPQVNGYKDKPSQYIYNRALALYIQLNHMLVTRSENADQGKEPFDWFDENLIDAWGEENKRSARKYESLFKPW